MRDTGIADRIRAMGVRVVEVDGWHDRGSSDFNAGGAVWHHTAGPSSGATPSLNVCINGRPDLAGPLCNVLQSREPDGTDIAYVIAAGRANHAGSGGWAGLSGNSSVYGLEVEHTGIEPLVPNRRKDIAIRIVAAMIQGRGDESKCCQHSEWTSRKIDIANDTDPKWYRTQCGMYLRDGGGATPPSTTDPEEFDLSKEQYDAIMRKLEDVESKVESVGGGQNAIYSVTAGEVDDIQNGLTAIRSDLDDHDKRETTRWTELFATGAPRDDGGDLSG